MFYRHFTILLLFLPVFLQALNDRLNIDLFELYISAIKQYNLDIFNKVLEDNFAIFDKNEIQITDRQRLLGLKIDHFRQRIPIRPYQIYDNVPGVSFKVRINENFLIEYKISKRNGMYKIAEETYLTEQKDGLGFFPLVDYDSFTKKLANDILTEYREMLIEVNRLNNILDVNYHLDSSETKNRKQFKKELEMLRGYIVAMDLDDKLITDAKFLGDRKFEFIWNYTTLIQARYVEKKKKYMLIFEMQAPDFEPFSTALIDYDLTAQKIAHKLAIDFFKSMSEKNENKFKDLFADTVEYQECGGNRSHMSRREFFERTHKQIKTVPEVIELYQVQENFRDRKMSFWMYLVPTKLNFGAIIFEVDLVKKESQLIRTRCVAELKVKAKLTRFV